MYSRSEPGSSIRTRAMSTIGRCAFGTSTPGRRVHGKFSIHDPCDATESISCTFAHVRRIPPVVEHHPALRVIGCPFRNVLLNRAVAAMPIHDEDASESTMRHVVENVANDGEMR